MRKIFVCVWFLSFTLLVQVEIDGQTDTLENSIDSLLNIRILNAIDHLHETYSFLPENKRQLFLNSIDDWFNNFYQLAATSKSNYSQSITADILINSKAQILNYRIQRKDLKWINWQQIQEKIKTDEALIDYFSFYDKKNSTEVFHAMLIKKGEPQPVFIPLTTVKPVDELLEAKDNLPLYLQYKESRQEMYGHVWQALEPYLKNIKTIHLTPVLFLNKIDFESLQNTEGQYLAGSSAR